MKELYAQTAGETTAVRPSPSIVVSVELTGRAADFLAQKVVFLRRDQPSKSVAVAAPPTVERVRSDESGRRQQRQARLFPGARLSRFPADEIARLVGRMVDASDRPGERHMTRDNPRIPSGYAYFGQLVNHDLSFDRDKGRAPRLDLATLYGADPKGGGRDAAGSNGRFKLGSSRGREALDLPRRPDGRAIIPDERNDTTLILAQLCALLMRFHNLLVERQGLASAEARRQAVLHYQSAVLSDLLPRLIRPDALDEARRERAGGKPFAQSTVPSEFSLAAYRLHTMTRNRYRLNSERYLELDQVLAFTGMGGARVFPLDPSLLIDWRLFFPARGREHDPLVNRSRRIDPFVARALHSLPLDENRVLAEGLKLPSGRKPTLALVDALIGNGQLPSAQEAIRWLRDHGHHLQSLTSEELNAGPLGALRNPSMLAETPLFYYLLREAEAHEDGLRMGPLGSRIIAETICGLLKADAQSILHRPDWQPLIPTSARNLVAIPDIVGYVRSA